MVGTITMVVELKLFNTGYCTHTEKMAIKGGKNVTCQFYATFALIKHPQIGNILFDTGYSDRFYSAVQKFPYSIYGKVTPVFHNSQESALSQLKKINSDDISKIVISHFHADHISGLKDFPDSKFLCLKSAFDDIKNKSAFNAVKRGFLPDLLPEDFEARVEFIDNYNSISLDKEFLPFETGFDIAGDGTILAVPLYGHAAGQTGLIVKTENQTYFLVGDACWFSKSYRENLPPHPFAGIIFSDKRDYLENLNKLHCLHLNNPEIKILPAHCPETLRYL